MEPSEKTGGHFLQRVFQVLGEGKINETLWEGKHLVLKPQPSKSAFALASQVFCLRQVTWRAVLASAWENATI